MLVAVQVFVLGLYRPPVFKSPLLVPTPPQTIISVPVQTAVWSVRASGALVVLVAVQESVLGLYLPPVFNRPLVPTPPQTIISLPIQTAVCANRALGALVVLVAVQVFVLGLYRPPVFKFDGARSHSAPDDHFTAGPNCRVEGSRLGRISGAGGCPGVRAGIVSPTSVKNCRCCQVRPRRSFHCRSKLPCGRVAHRAHWWCWWLSRYPCWDCISRQC